MTATTTGGVDPAAPERQVLMAALREQRAHVLRSLEGLSEDDLRRPVLPSGWTCLGLVQHLALDVERFWFRAVVAGEDVHLAAGDEAWRVDPVTPVQEVLDGYRAEAGRSDAVVDALALDAAPAWWPSDLFAQLPERDLRGTVLHVLAETACHAGHLDVVRELLDGRQHLVLT